MIHCIISNTFVRSIQFKLVLFRVMSIASLFEMALVMAPTCAHCMDESNYSCPTWLIYGDKSLVTSL